VPGAAGGGSWFPVTVPAGAGVSGAGCWSSIDENRDVEQPLAISAASDTATRPVFEKVIPTSVGPGWGDAVRAISPSTKMEKVAEFQPDMVKIGFSGQLLQFCRNRRVTLEGPIMARLDEARCRRQYPARPYAESPALGTKT
ncbi:hypothetical protein, partial [Mesorhizobium sp.]|uniref:hypothetical protein n=1 Tax=Mesorhizobium sp. TaxID=1871066 RepID=UPI0025B92341